MFGYILPEKPHLYIKDFNLYQAMYCGICKAQGKCFGQLSRFLINYDITFLGLFIHNYLGEDVTLTKLKCISKPFTQRQMVASNELTDKIAATNLLLSYYKIVDNIIDDNSIGAKMSKVAFKKAYKKAAVRLPEIDKAIRVNYEELRKLEKMENISIDRLAHPFANMMREIGENLAVKKSDDNFSNLCYNVGKFIYIIDAIDDLDDDFKDNKFNPLFSHFGERLTKEIAREKYSEQLDFIALTTVNSIKRDFSNIKFSFNNDLLSNIVNRGMPIKMRLVKEEKKCKKIYI